MITREVDYALRIMLGLTVNNYREIIIRTRHHR